MNTNRLTLAILIAVMAAALAACGGGGGDDADEAEINPFGLEVQSVAAAASPVALTFAPDGRLFFAEKYTGNIRVVDAAGNLLSEPFAHIDVANWLDLDWGLTGLALDPDFATNHYVYAFYTEVAVADNERPIGRPVLARFTDQDGRGTDMTVFIDDFPETRLDHQGFKTNGAIHFGPDGALYLTMGDYDWGKGGPTAPALRRTCPSRVARSYAWTPAPCRCRTTRSQANRRLIRASSLTVLDMVLHSLSIRIQATCSPRIAPIAARSSISCGPARTTAGRMSGSSHSRTATLALKSGPSTSSLVRGSSPVDFSPGLVSPASRSCPARSTRPWAKACSSVARRTA